MYYIGNDGTYYEVPSHCVDSSIGDYYYGDGHALHQIEKMLNPLVGYSGMVGISALIGEDFYRVYGTRKI